MDLESMWAVFLSKIELKLKPVLFQTWFKETKLIDLNNEYAIIEVPLDVHKKHLQENYGEIIKETFMEVTGSIFKFKYVTPNEASDEIKTETTENNEAVFESGLDSKYTFDNFIAGESNKFAKAIGLAVAEKPGAMYNPLFIYGSSGLGKTHLMHAIGNYIVSTSNKKVLYVTSEKFVDDFLNIYRKNETSNFKAVDNFKRKYRDIDVLMIDDIQYLEIASKTQQEFFNTFNELHTKNKQIIISSDRSPDDLKKLEDRLRTRFNWGLTIDILPPELDLRLAILDKKIEAHNISSFVPMEVKEYIANNCTTDIRKLEGALTRVFAYATIMNGSEITLELAIEALKDYIGKNIISRNKIDQVIQLVANNYNITVEDIKSKKRLSKIAVPRQIGMYICRVHLKESLPKIGSEFGGKDHTTVMHSVAKIKSELKKDKNLEVEISKIINQIK
ncbi:MAG: chromosomal replication initiator protein DnaA [Bacilli bacterium]|nr:chromosomal replication initiator protein DnaA [Bacilli bacterium]